MILLASWFVCRWWADRLDVTRTVPARSLMGLVAFLALILAQAGLGAVLGRLPQRKISHLAEFFEAIWGVDGHEHVEIPGSR